MSVTLHRSSEFTVALPPDQAIMLFTPEGERRWADGWNPRYPEPERREGPGAVFTTEHGGHHATWIVVDHTAQRLRYARVVHGATAGTVEVSIVSSTDRATVVRVTYDLTALTAMGAAWLDDFDEGYEDEIASWSKEIAAALRPTGPR
jgi:hypothetical protein